ncbi:MAG: sugar phosphate isomerase/epimerase [Spirochaetales bacterium]|nr:sugar phosphate isomerase/epimerase [Spirochaetales bacterium]
MSDNNYKYTSNGWGYHQLGESVSVKEIAGRICSLGFDGFDLLAGEGAFPACSIDETTETWEKIRYAAEDAGGRISSLVLVGCPLQDEDKCLREFKRALEITKILGTDVVNLLPRKTGITHDEGFRRLKRIWNEIGSAYKDAGLTVNAENHVWTPEPDDDIFLLRTEADFHKLIEVTDSGILVKFDPVWLLKPGAGEQPVPAFERLLPHVGILDLKDCTFPDGKIVSPGTGVVDFKALAKLAADSRITSLSVEAEEHMRQTPPLTDSKAIDAVHTSALKFYKTIFEKE